MNMIRGTWDGLTCPMWKPTPRVKANRKNNES